MTIEVRQLVIRTQVDASPAPAGGAALAGGHDRERVKQEILAECRSWLAQQLAREIERVRDGGRDR